MARGDIKLTNQRIDMTRLPSSQTPKSDFDLSPPQRFSAFIVPLEIIHGDSVG